MMERRKGLFFFVFGMFLFLLGLYSINNIFILGISLASVGGLITGVSISNVLNSK